MQNIHIVPNSTKIIRYIFTSLGKYRKYLVRNMDCILYLNPVILELKNETYKSFYNIVQMAELHLIFDIVQGQRYISLSIKINWKKINFFL